MFQDGTICCFLFFCFLIFHNLFNRLHEAKLTKKSWSYKEQKVQNSSRFEIYISFRETKLHFSITLNKISPFYSTLKMQMLSRAQKIPWTDCSMLQFATSWTADHFRCVVHQSERNSLFWEIEQTGASVKLRVFFLFFNINLNLASSLPKVCLWAYIFPLSLKPGRR